MKRRLDVLIRCAGLGQTPMFLARSQVESGSCHFSIRIALTTYCAPLPTVARSMSQSKTSCDRFEEARNPIVRVDRVPPLDEQDADQDRALKAHFGACQTSPAPNFWPVASTIPRMPVTSSSRTTTTVAIQGSMPAWGTMMR